MDKSTVFHDDGTVTLWDRRSGTLLQRTRIVSDKTLAALPPEDRRRILSTFTIRWPAGWALPQPDDAAANTLQSRKEFEWLENELFSRQGE